MAWISCSSYSSPQYCHVSSKTNIHVNKSTHTLHKTTLNFTYSLPCTKCRHPFCLKANPTNSDVELKSNSNSPSNNIVDDDVRTPSSELSKIPTDSVNKNQELVILLGAIWEWGLLISPFFFWGTAMVAMKEVLPKAGPFFVSSFRLIPAGFLVVAFAAFKGRKFPSGFNAWFSIILFALVDATCFQGFLAEGLQRTSAGLGSVCEAFHVKILYH
ncbi:transporter [Lithospermum erythrorhizon]|uniref:Transporter n=1 Tax=Lithospermum erythrorhizon TaxID=34254 RepID=A0AAV3P7T2_LITER